MTPKVPQSGMSQRLESLLLRLSPDREEAGRAYIEIHERLVRIWNAT